MTPEPAPARDYESQWWDGSRARVFISCGQRDDEIGLADDVARQLWTEGYSPYVGRRARSPDGLKEAIFRYLRTAEYCIFIDLPRETLGGTAAKSRGSLYSHQELAVASFLRIPILPFQHESVVREGVLAEIQGNAVTFSKNSEILDALVPEIEKMGWQKQWRAELKVSPQPTYSGPVGHPTLGSAIYFHLDIENKHYSETAQDVRVFADSVQSPGDVSPRPLPIVEMKFRYLRMESVSVAPGVVSEADAALVPLSAPTVAWLGLNLMLVDETSIPDKFRVTGRGDHKIEFSVHCNPFRTVRVNTILTLSDDWKKTTHKRA